MINPLRVLITGTDKGIGYELVKIFLKKNQEAMIYATKKESKQATDPRWKQFGGDKRVFCKYLDVSSLDSIAKFVQQLQKEKVTTDILINNAGIYGIQGRKDDTLPELQSTKNIIKTNLIGPMHLTKLLLPFLSMQARIINVSSYLSALNFHSAQIQQKFSNPNIQYEDILTEAQSYIQSVERKDMKGKCTNPYSTSKMLLNAWSRFVLQKRWLKEKQTAICVSPGLCSTSMTKSYSQQLKFHTPQSGALKIYEAAVLKDVNPEIFYYRSDPSDFFRCGEGLPFKDD